MPAAATSNPDIATVVSLALEKSIQLALRYDPATREKLRTLAPTRIALSIYQPDIQLLFFIEDSAIEESAVRVSMFDEADDADIRLTGKASEFLSLMGKETHSLADVDIDVSGKVSVLNQLQSILADLDIDWEEPLTEILGIVPGHTVANLVRNALTWGKTQQQNIHSALPEILTEELRLLPAQAELSHFYNAVDDVSAATQRLQARIQQLHNTLNKSA